MTTTEPKTEIAVFRQSLQAMLPRFKPLLPAHVNPDKFAGVIMTVVQTAPDLLQADRRSLFAAATKCAQDGLIPDGRDAALVVFNVNVGNKQNPNWQKHVQYMPMVAGIMKKVRQSGTIANWSVHVVKEGDTFDYELGDNERLTHKPALQRGATIAAYSIVKYKSGEVSREIMSRADIDATRAVSRAGDTEYGPWAKWYDEMAKKAVIKRHAKRLDMDTEDADRPLLATIRADDELTSFDEPPMLEAAPENKPPKPTRLPGAKKAAASAQQASPPTAPPPADHQISAMQEDGDEAGAEEMP